MPDRSVESANKVFDAIKAVLKKNPDLRVGQILCNTLNYGALYYSENDMLVKTLKDFYNITDEDIAAVTEQPEPDAPEEISEPKSSNKGRVYINKDGASKAVHPEEVAKYKKAGWSLGRANSKYKI